MRLGACLAQRTVLRHTALSCSQQPSDQAAHSGAWATRLILPRLHALLVTGHRLATPSLLCPTPVSYPHALSGCCWRRARCWRRRAAAGRCACCRCTARCPRRSRARCSRGEGLAGEERDIGHGVRGQGYLAMRDCRTWLRGFSSGTTGGSGPCTRRRVREGPNRRTYTRNCVGYGVWVTAACVSEVPSSQTGGAPKQGPCDVGYLCAVRVRSEATPPLSVPNYRQVPRRTCLAPLVLAAPLPARSRWCCPPTWRRPPSPLTM